MLRWLTRRREEREAERGIVDAVRLMLAHPEARRLVLMASKRSAPWRHIPELDNKLLTDDKK